MHAGRLFALWVVATAPLLVACGDSEDAEARPPDAGGGGSTTALGCDPGTVELTDGTCRPAGFDEAGCAEGFAAADVGCTAVLPPRPCPEGTMAVPGETRCRDVMPCAPGPFGDLTGDPTTQWVLAGAPAATADGTQDHPWPTIQEGVDAAMPGAVVVVGAGSYPEALAIATPVEIRGKCPADVAIVGPAAAFATVTFAAPAAGSVLSGVAVTGDTIGVAVTAADVTVERVWIHDTSSIGIVADNGFADDAGFALRDSLVERVVDLGVFVVGASATMDRSVVRAPQPTPSGDFGRAINVQYFPMSSTPGRLDVTASVVEQSREFGVYVSGSEVTIAASVVRDTLPGNRATGWGRAVNAQARSSEQWSRVEITGSVIERCLENGIYATGTDVYVSGTSIRDVLPADIGDYGRGIEISAWGADARRPILEVSGSLVERSREVGIMLAGSEATITTTVVRDILPNGLAQGGRGISAQPAEQSQTPTTLVVRDSSVDRTLDVGIYFISSNGSVEHSLVRDTHPGAAGFYGDGIGLLAPNASATIQSSRVQGSSRAGVSSFGGIVGLGANVLECNGIHLNQEAVPATPIVDDLGGNTCGCDGNSVVCTVLSSNLAPPDKLAEGQAR